ncbi:MAG: hypothetical protein ACYCZX_20560, partial [Rhodospirillaceae bacterium]
EASIRQPVSDIFASGAGDLSFHANFSYYIKDVNSSPVITTTDGVGSYGGNGTAAGPPRWRLSANLGWNSDPYNISLTGRAISSGLFGKTSIECTSGCPTSTTNATTINNNHVPGAFYLDASFGYKLSIGEDVRSDLFFNVRNLLDKDPPIVAIGNYQQVTQTRVSNFDVIGRTYRLGIRFKM